MDESFYRKRKKWFEPAEITRRLRRNKGRVVVIGVAVVLAGFTLFGSRGFVHRFQLERQKAELEQKIREAEAEQKRLQQESRSLDTNKRTIEKVAREQYDMTRPGETVYKTPPGR